MAVSLPSFPAFEVHLDGNVGPRWKKWLTRFENLTIGMKITDEKQKRALLLHYSGPEVDDIFDTFEETGEDYKTAVEKLTAHFNPQVNTTYEVYNFRKAQQKETESLDSFHTRLRTLAKTCEFTDIDKEIKEQIILSCKSNALRRKALREDLNLTNLLKTGRALELSEVQAKEVESDKGTVNAIKLQDKKGKGPRRNRQQNRRRQEQNQESINGTRNESHKPNRSSKCRNCGGTYPHKDSCPAKNKKCKSCGKLNHFARVCRTNPPETVKRVTEEDTDEEGYVYAVSGDRKQPMCRATIDGKHAELMLDSGASVNLIDETTYKEIYKGKEKPLTKARRQIYSYGSSSPLPLLGAIKAKIAAKSNSISATLHVVKGHSGNLLGYDTAQKLGLVKIVNQVTVKTSSQYLADGEFKDLFGGIGKVRGKLVKLHIDPDVQPKQQPHRRIPFHVRKDVERELERLESLDIIERVTGPTPWVSPIVVVPKASGEVRICIDMREANKAVKREKHLMPTIDDLVADLNGATVFSKLDLSSGYHQLELAPESRHITTFSTHIGLRRYKRLLFGINAASEVFQNAIEEILTGLQGCKNISDDIIVFGATQQEHDENLHSVLTRLQQHGVRLNKDKCSFSQKEVKFYGHFFSSEGITADPEKIEAITNMGKPENVSEVKSLLGMAQYVSRYIPEYATITAPLRQLTKKEAPWQWSDEQQKAFDNLKNSLTKSHVMSYFNPEKKTEVIVDASPTGLGALLVQDGKVISYASRALSDVESRYSQTEREMLAVVWAAEHFHLYLYGSEFTIATDHKPLLGIFDSHKPTSARIDRWKLRLMPYSCQLVYRPGRDAENPADFMSRHPNTRTSNKRNVADEYVNYVCNNAVPKAMTLSDIKSETKEDSVLQSLIKAIETDRWMNPEVQDYKKVKEELLVHNGVVLRGKRIVVPSKLRDQAVQLAHVGHQGIVKTKQLIREKVWFPGIDQMVKDRIDNCLACQAVTPSKSSRIEPLQMTPLPSGPWKKLAVDFLGPYPSGDYLLVVIDEYSRFPEVEIVRSTSAKAVIPKLDAIFARQGIPDELKTDNGPPFQGDEFKNFARYLGFYHRKVQPVWPRANGEAERFMPNLEKCVLTAVVENKNWKQELYIFLRQYRATPHTTTNVSPCEALNGRKLKTTLPEIVSTQPEQHTPQELHKRLTERDAEQKEKIKAYADKKLRVRPSDIKPGDTVLVRQQKKNKLSTPYRPEPLVVEEKKGSMVTASDGLKSITRNSSMFKVIPSNLKADPEWCKHEEEPEDFVTETQDVSKEKTPSLSDSVNLRRSGRERRPPKRFADYVQVIF